MSRKVILVWFRNDLRTHDNEVLSNATEKADFVIPVFIFDPRYYETNKSGFLNTGEIRKQYIFNSVKKLKDKLQSIGGDLLTFEGYPEEIIPQLVQKYDVDEVFHHREVAKRETDISELVESALWKIKRNLRHFIGHTLYHKENLPFPIKDIPKNFNLFKKKIEKESFVRQPIPSVNSINIPPHLEKTNLPDDGKLIESSTGSGEDDAIAELNKIIRLDRIENELYVRLSPYIAIGSLSPIYTYHKLAGSQNIALKKNIVQITDRLLRRDYFRFMMKKHPSQFFTNKSQSVEFSPDRLKNWIDGKTNYLEINQMMHDLNRTGNIGYSEREQLGLHLIYEEKSDWLDGAAWFEQQLIDYAPATNYGFWAHLAGQGTSDKENKSLEDWEKAKNAMTKI